MSERLERLLTEVSLELERQCRERLCAVEQIACPVYTDVRVEGGSTELPVNAICYPIDCGYTSNLWVVGVHGADRIPVICSSLWGPSMFEGALRVMNDDGWMFDRIVEVTGGVVVLFSRPKVFRKVGSENAT